MQSWLKGGARMTVAVTAFAAAGAGIACCHADRSGPGQAGPAGVELTALARPAGGGPLTKEFGLTTGISRPLGCMSYIGKPAGTVRLPAQYTNPADITGSHREAVFCTTASGTNPAPPSHSTTPATHHATKTGKSHRGSKGGHAKSGKPGKSHHKPAGHHKPASHHKPAGHHKPASHHHGAVHHKSRHHTNGGKPASSGAKKVTTASTAASLAADTGTLPTTGAPMAGLLALAVAALAAGLVVRHLAKRDDEAEPQEG
jgi:hypothetical protein